MGGITEALEGHLHRLASSPSRGVGTLSCLSPQILTCPLTIPLGGAFFGGRHLAASLVPYTVLRPGGVSLRAVGSNPGTESPAGSPSKAPRTTPAPLPPGQQDSHGFCPPSSFSAGQKGVNGYLLSFQMCYSLHVT